MLKHCPAVEYDKSVMWTAVVQLCCGLINRHQISMIGILEMSQLYKCIGLPFGGSAFGAPCSKNARTRKFAIIKYFLVLRRLKMRGAAVFQGTTEIINACTVVAYLVVAH